MIAAALPDYSPGFIRRPETRASDTAIEWRDDPPRAQPFSKGKRMATGAFCAP